MGYVAVFILLCLSVTQLNIDILRKPKEAIPIVSQEKEEEETKKEELDTKEDVSKEDVSKEERFQFERNNLDYDKVAATYPNTPIENHSQIGYNDSKSWWFKRTDSKEPPSAQGDIAILDYEAFYLGDTSRKVIYLTFDEGYEMGYTEGILDTLKENNVPAAFFVTRAFMKDEPELTIRMAIEGHVVGNHSVTHPKMSTITDEKILQEINGCADYYKEITGKDMDLFFRPPTGEYSIRTLEKTQEAGYKTIFWSFAYKDWLVDEQPGKEAAYDTIMKYSHNGCIMLLHAVSKSNADALDDAIKDLKSQGYVFESLYNLPEADKLLNKIKEGK